MSWKPALNRRRRALWLAVFVSTFVAFTAVAGADTVDTNLDAATRITQIFIWVGATVMLVGGGIWWLRNKKT